MKSLGVVSDINHKGELLVKNGKPLESGTVVFDARKQKVGSVVRTFGPVKSPYLLIKTKPDGDNMRLLGAELYFGGGDRKTKRV